MSSTLRFLAVLPLACAPLGLASTPAQAAGTTTSQFSDVIGSCAPGDDLVADFTIRERMSVKDGREQLHLRLTGTVTRTGTGVVGRYAETQLDKFGDDGSEVYSGKLSHLVVPGTGVLRAAGHAVFSADGDARFTPGLAVLSSDDFTGRVCDLLA